jgi:hypothetical protein
MSRRGIPPDLGIDTGEVNPLVEPVTDLVVARIGNIVRKAGNAFMAD